MSTVLFRLSKFAKASMFQKTIISVIISLNADKKELERIKQIFEEIDIDQDGRLTPNELKASAAKF